jgi:Glycosyl hydrolases family 43
MLNQQILMKNIPLIVCSVFFAVLPCLAVETTNTPPAADSSATPYDAQEFRPGNLWLDDKGVHINAHGGGMLFHDGMYYWFGEHKVEGTAGNKAQVGVHVYSSTNLYSWKDEGIALAVSQDPSNEITQGCILERPKVIFNEKTKKFVMWFHLELKGQGYHAARSGVAISDKVTGPYQYLNSFRPNAGVWPKNFPQDERKVLSPEEKIALSNHKFDSKQPAGEVPFANLACRRDFEGGQMSRDMTLFVDDDGKAYQIYSSEENGTIQISQLTDDYLKPAGQYIRILPAQFNEAPALFKHDGKYFLITSGTSSWAPNAARLAAADSIMGIWTHLGNPCRGTEQQTGKTFESQSTYVLPVPGKKDAFIFMADRWRPKNAIDGRYIWLPVQWDKGIPFLQWQESWERDRSFPSQAKWSKLSGF